jgi:hypothetical protein
MKALMLLLLAGLSAAQAAEPTGTLTLACEGTVNDFNRLDDKVPISTGIIINFATQTVVGLAAPANSSIKILAMDEVTVTFGGGSSYPDWSIAGSINRVTGDVEGDLVIIHRQDAYVDTDKHRAEMQASAADVLGTMNVYWVGDIPCITGPWDHRLVRHHQGQMELGNNCWKLKPGVAGVSYNRCRSLFLE